jgi:hypothetical protein
LINSAEDGIGYVEGGKMLKAASYALQGITIVALLCASVIRAKTEMPTSSSRPMLQLGLGTAALHWIDDAGGWDWGMPVHKQESIHQTFSVPPVAGRRAIEVENVFGSIEIAGSDGDAVQMDVDKSIHAESNQALERAQKEVTLDIEQDPGRLKVEVRYPPHCALPDCGRFEDHSYAVETNFRMQAPRDSDLTLKTVDGRAVRVRDVSGMFSVSNVNGGITMDEIKGSGTARTVNGQIHVTFRENPRNDSQFASVNGSVDLYFAKDLSADFRFRTSSGSVYSDFPMSAAPVSEERHGGVLYFRTSSFAGGRVGAGGPLVRVESLNGDVRILEKHD